jgi:hypothetical protein
MASRDRKYPPAEAGVTSGAIPVAPPSDPLWSDVPLDHRIEVRVFGLPLAVESNFPLIGRLVEEALGPVAVQVAAGDPGGPADSATRVRLRVILEPTVTAHHHVEPTQWRMYDADHALLRAPGIVGWIDFTASQGVLYVEEFRVRDGAEFRHAIIRGPALYLMNRRDRHPVHAAALRNGDAALILVGSSGSGKSTLCYAASRAGVEVFSDDAVRVQHTPELRIWGSPGHVNLLDDSCALFSELRQDDSARMMVNGKVKHVITVATGVPGAPAFVRRARVCILGRERGRVVRVPATAEEIVRRITGAPEAISDASPKERAPAAVALAARGGWTLTLSADPNEALPHLLEMLAEV